MKKLFEMNLRQNLTYNFTKFSCFDTKKKRNLNENHEKFLSSFHNFRTNFTNKHFIFYQTLSNFPKLNLNCCNFFLTVKVRNLQKRQIFVILIQKNKI